MIAAVLTGNKGTAHQWAAILESLGHQIVNGTEEADLLIALHAQKGRQDLLEFRQEYPSGLTVLALTGTDIYPAPDNEAIQTMQLADALVVLQPKALDRLPHHCRAKAHVIVQSAMGVNLTTAKSTDPFLICVTGHLRDVKDPMRAAEAARTLPPESKIRIEHAGAVLDPKYHAIVAAEKEKNPRYHHHGELPEEDVRDLMRRSQATVLSSRAEGGARVIGESIAEGTPLLATRIDGTTGLLGDDYPALFPFGDTQALADLLLKLEREPAFRAALHDEVNRLSSVFAPAAEKAAWHKLLSQLSK